MKAIVTYEHTEIRRLTMAWCNQMPYMAIWDKQKLAKDIALCVNKIIHLEIKKANGKNTKAKRKSKAAKKH
jgi:hypothetical protein